PRAPTATQALDDLTAVPAAAFATQATPKELRRFIAADAELMTPRPRTPASGQPAMYVSTGQAGVGQVRPQPPTKTSSMAGQVLSESAAAPRRRMGLWVSVGAIVAAAAAGGAALASQPRKPGPGAVLPARGTPTRAAPPPAPAPSPPAAVVAPPQPVKGRLTIRPAPGDARIFIDGVPSSPVREDFDLHRTVKLRVERDGYLAQETDVAVAADTIVPVGLAQAPAPRPAP